MCRNFSRLGEALQLDKAEKVLRIAEKVLILGKKLRDFFRRKQTITRIPSIVGYFVREEDKNIKEKVKTLCCKSNLSSVKTLILHGPPGHGKQYSAANVMHRLYTSPMANSFVLRTGKMKPWFLFEKPTIRSTLNATDTSTMLESYCELAEDMGLNKEVKVAKQELQIHSRTAEGRQQHMYLHDHFQKHADDKALKQISEAVIKKLRQQDSWALLILVGNENVSGLENYWPQPGDHNLGNGLVIMTSQYPNGLVKEDINSCLEKVCIGKMTDNDAVKFFESKSGIKATGADKMHAKDLAVKMLKCIPQNIAM